MATESYQSQLETIQAAISDIVAGRIQSYAFSGRSVTRLSIDILYKEEVRLRQMAAREARGGGASFRLAQPQ